MWHDSTPPNFVFSVKGGRYLTHLRKLKDPRQPLANFFASGLLCLRAKLGPILWQFPPFMPFDEDRFKKFFDLLPHDTLQAARLGKKHSAFLKDRVFLEPDENRPVRHALEFRHESFLSDRFITLLRKYKIALVAADVASRFPTAQDVTADFVYVRLHGSRQLYASGYSPREIDAWAAHVRAWSQGLEPPGANRISGKPAPSAPQRDVYVFFDNTDVKLRAPVDARRMAKTLGVGPTRTPAQVLKDLGVKPKPRKTKARGKRK
jgi:uncharacterized protein YecE (DUF72 family)